MTEAEFAGRVIAMQDALYRVSTTILPRLCDREDAVQSAIEKALRKRGRLRDEAALEKWLMRIVINECYTIHRRRRREVLCGDPAARAPARGAAPRRAALIAALVLLLAAAAAAAFHSQVAAYFGWFYGDEARQRLEAGDAQPGDASALDPDALTPLPGAPSYLERARAAGARLVAVKVTPRALGKEETPVETAGYLLFPLEDGSLRFAFEIPTEGEPKGALKLWVSRWEIAPDGQPLRDGEDDTYAREEWRVTLRSAPPAGA